MVIGRPRMFLLPQLPVAAARGVMADNEEEEIEVVELRGEGNRLKFCVHGWGAGMSTYG